MYFDVQHLSRPTPSRSFTIANLTDNAYSHISHLTAGDLSGGPYVWRLAQCRPYNTGFKPRWYEYLGWAKASTSFLTSSQHRYLGPHPHPLTYAPVVFISHLKSHSQSRTYNRF